MNRTDQQDEILGDILKTAATIKRIIPNGTRVNIVSPESWDNGGWGIVKQFDGEQYHVAMYGDDNMQPVFDRRELRVPKRPTAAKIAKQYGPVYHGTYHEWSDKIQIDQYKIGKFFSSDPLVAQAYGSLVHECYLTMNNPFIVDAKGSGYSSIPTPKKLKGWVADGMDTVDTDILAKYAYENGYDGSIIKNVIELHEPTKADDYIVFKSNQVKLKGIIEPEISPYTANKYHKQELQRRYRVKYDLCEHGYPNSEGNCPYISEGLCPEGQKSQQLKTKEVL